MKEIIILSDSLKVLTALKNKNSLIVKLVNKFHLISVSMDVMFWIPSHIGIIGNNKADSDAKHV